jgi:hypothetical protein
MCQEAANLTDPHICPDRASLPAADLQDVEIPASDSQPVERGGKARATVATTRKAVNRTAPLRVPAEALNRLKLKLPPGTQIVSLSPCVGIKKDKSGSTKNGDRNSADSMAQLAPLTPLYSTSQDEPPVHLHPLSAASTDVNGSIDDASSAAENETDSFTLQAKRQELASAQATLAAIAVEAAAHEAAAEAELESMAAGERSALIVIAQLESKRQSVAADTAILEERIRERVAKLLHVQTKHCDEAASELAMIEKQELAVEEETGMLVAHDNACKLLDAEAERARARTIEHEREWAALDERFAAAERMKMDAQETLNSTHEAVEDARQALLAVKMETTWLLDNTDDNESATASMLAKAKHLEERVVNETHRCNEMRRDIEYELARRRKQRFTYKLAAACKKLLLGCCRAPSADIGLV